MSISNKDMRRILVAFLVLILFIGTYMIISPILLSILGGLVLAYIFNPLYKRFLRFFKEKNTAAFSVSALIIILLIIPLWFLIPLAIEQTFSFFEITQNIDFTQIVSKVFPTADPEFKKEIISMVIRFIGDIASGAINTLIGFLLNLPNVLLQIAIIVFVFFFSLRDQDILKEFVSGISPFKKDKEKILITKFKEITSSIIFGYIVIGIIQGIVLGIGLIIFGVPRAITLTIFAIFASIIPMVGPWLVWIPVAIFMLAKGNTALAIGFAVYSGVLVSSIDNVLRPYIVAKKTKTSSVIVLVGMIGGLYVFGILGIILGPLILSYLILFLRAYKDKTLSDMFSPD